MKLELYSELSKLFYLGHRFIKADNTDTPNWVTICKHPLNSGGFIKYYGSLLFLLGVSFGTQTLYAMLDIDIDSPYHPANNRQAFQKLLDALNRIGLVYPVFVRSSNSGGLHVYFFFPRPLKTFNVATLIHVTLINAGFAPKPGDVELFPNPKAHTNTPGEYSNYRAHRLPVQPASGSWMVDAWGDPIMNLESLTHEGQVLMFLREAEKSAQAHSAYIEQIEAKLDWTYTLYKQKIDKYQHPQSGLSEVAQEWQENLELSMMVGWTGYHQTNIILPLFVAYGIVFMGLDDKQKLFDWIYANVLTTRGYKEYCRHQHEIDKRIWAWVDGTLDSEYYVKYCGFPPRKGISVYKLIKHLQQKGRKPNEHNQKLADRTFDRLQGVVKVIGTLPCLIVERIAVIQAKYQELFGTKISNNTLYKKNYLSLWNDKNTIVTLVNSPTSMKSTELSLDNASIASSIEEESSSLTVATLFDADVSHTILTYEVSFPSLPAEQIIFSETEEINLTTDELPNLESDLLVESSPNLIQSELRPEILRFESEQSLFGLDIEVLPNSEPELSCLEASSDISIAYTPVAAKNLPNNINETYRSTVEIACEIRACHLQPDDRLLLELLHHPSIDSIEQLLELGSRLLDSKSWADVEDLAGGLSPVWKQDLWSTFTNREQAVINALKAQSEVKLVSVALPDDFVANPATSEPPEPVALATEAIVEIGTMLRRNRIDLCQGKYAEAIEHCEVIGRNGSNWVVRSPEHQLFNVSSFALISGEWEVERDDNAAAVKTVAKVPQKSFGIEDVVRAVTGLVGRIKRIYKYSNEPYAIEDDLGKIHRFNEEDLFPT
jgi:hypothetical protein